MIAELRGWPRRRRIDDKRRRLAQQSDPTHERSRHGIGRRNQLTGIWNRAADSQRSFPLFRRRCSVSSRSGNDEQSNVRISKFPFEAPSCKGSRWPWKTKGRRKRSRSPRLNHCMPCWDLGDIGTQAGTICPDPAKIPEIRAGIPPWRAGSLPPALHPPSSFASPCGESSTLLAP